MKTLQVERASIVVKLSAGSDSTKTLGAQLQPYLDAAPVLILDVEGIQFTSMLIGEIVNVHQRFAKRWQDRPHRIALVNLTDTSRAAFERVRLDAYFPIYASLAEACAGSNGAG